MGKDLNVNNFPVLKEGTITLFSALTATVTEANTPAINMIGARGGSLEVVINSGAGTISFELMSSETGAEPYYPMYNYNLTTPVQYPNITTTTTVSAAYQIGSFINSNWLKLVPNVSGTVNATVYFTPSVS